jgi:tetratricopeptide (TPR) repeat protein
MPEWLDMDTELEEPGQTGWLSSLSEPDVMGWLEEEEATMSSAHDRHVPSRHDPQPDLTVDSAPLPPESDLQLDLDTDSLTLPEEEFMPSVLELDEEQLSSARQAIAAGQYDQALQSYQSLVDAGSGMMTLIADLEGAAEKYGEQPFIRHLLGDAYMRNGQLQKALDTYRSALDQL